MARIAKITRPSKLNIKPEALHAGWKEELKALGTSIEDYTKAILEAPERDRTQLTPRAAMNYAISHLSETEAHFDKYSLLKEAMVSVYGHVDIDAMTRELKDRVDKGQLLESEDGRWLKPASTHRLEQKITNELTKGHLQGRVLTLDKFEAHSGAFEGLTPGQQKSAKLALTNQHRFVGIEGTAGTGKTYLNDVTLPFLKELGYEIIGMAPTLEAVEQLEKEKFFDKTMTVQAFHKKPAGSSKTVLVVDEAGLIGNEIMHSILNHANSKNMPRVVLQGDPKQLGPIEAGRPFEQLLSKGLRSVHMEDIVRQKSKRHRKGVVQLSKHEVKEAFLTFQKEIHQVPLKDQESYVLKLRAKMNDPSIIVNTNAQREAINKAISKTNADGLHGPESHKQKIWTPVYLSKAQKMRAANYEGASHIRFNRDVGREFKKGEIYRIDKVDHEKAQLILKTKNTSKAYSPARHGSGASFTHVYKQSEITLNQGDKIKFRQTDKKLGITNNDYGIIQSLFNGQVTISRDDKKPISLPIGHRLLGHLDHAWANTTHSFQGVTVENNIAVMNATQSPLNTLEALYVAGSRHKDKLAIVTDDKDRLLRVISEKLDIAAETITFKEPLQMRLVDPKTITENRERSSQQEQSNERYNTTDVKSKSRHTLNHKENTPPDSIQRERGDRGR